MTFHCFTKREEKGVCSASLKALPLPPEKEAISKNDANTTICVKVRSRIKSFVIVSTAAQSNSWFALTRFSSVSMCVLRGRGAPTRQDYENQSPSPSRKAEAWLSAYRPVLIRLTHCDTWCTTKDRRRTHRDSPAWR